MNKTEQVSNETKRVYNDYLASCRSFKRKPFKIRKDFNKFEKNDYYRKYVYLAKWFKLHPEINRQLYFEATLYFNSDLDIVPIADYCKPKALKNYFQYLKMLETLDLDNIKSLTICKEGFVFISKFCKEQGINVSEYITFREDPTFNYTFLKHIKNNNISVYQIFAFDDAYAILKTLYRDMELWNFYIGSNTPLFYLQRYNNSVKYKQLAKQAILKIQSKLN